MWLALVPLPDCKHQWQQKAAYSTRHMLTSLCLLHAYLDHPRIQASQLTKSPINLDAAWQITYQALD